MANDFPTLSKAMAGALMRLGSGQCSRSGRYAQYTMPTGAVKPQSEDPVTASIIYGGAALLREEGGREPRVCQNAGVYQTGGVVQEIGAVSDLRRKYPNVATIGSLDEILLPGLINSHHHVGITSLQLGTLDQPLETTFAARLAHRDVDPYLDTLHSAFEMIASGITSVHHLHNPRRGSVRQWRPAAERILDAYRAVGMRVTYSFMVRVQSRIIYGDDEKFVRDLPEALQRSAQEHLESYSAGLDQFVEHFEGLYKAHAGDPRVAIYLAPGNLHWCTDESLVALARLAKDYSVGMHMHLLETPYQRAYAYRSTGKSAVRYLSDLGILGPDLTLGHCAWCSEEDLDLIAASGTMTCHLPSSNLRLHNGIAPLRAFLDRGITVALGMDECTLNDDRDILFEMRLASKLHHAPGIGNRSPTGAEIIAMATESAAKTTGFAGRTGVLSPGYAADCLLIDRRRLGYPYLDESVPALDAVLYRAKPGHVNTVIVDGEILYQNGVFTRLDAEAARSDLAERMKSPLTEEDLARRRFAQALVPHVARHYDGWLDSVTPLRSGL